jgi:hypothetical protein
MRHGLVLLYARHLLRIEPQGVVDVLGLNHRILTIGLMADA